MSAANADANADAARPAEGGRVYNFAAGPATLPLEVLRQVQKDLLDFKGTGASVMELSHRSPEFGEVIRGAERDLRELLAVPDNYSVMFMQGGGWGQFAAVPLNLLGASRRADYLVTGGWSANAAKEAARYCDVNVVASSEDRERAPGVWRSVPPRDSWQLSPPGEAAYLHYCANETVMGVQMHEVPDVPEGTTLVADFSSCFLAAPLDVSRFGLVYAGAQKNVGPSGVTIVLARNELLEGREPAAACPTVMRYSVMRAKGSMHNTPPTFAIYVAGLVFRHLLERGGLEAAARRNAEKAAALYGVIDENPAVFLPNAASAADRSVMNVVFRVAGADGAPSAEREAKFLERASARGLYALKGHRSIGGLRASIYNAMPLEGVQALAAFMREFAATPDQ